MAFGIYHSFVSAKADSGDATLLQPSNWNAALVLEDATSGGVLYASSTTAPACSALLAAGGLVVGGGAGAAPLTYANLTYTETSGPMLQVGTSNGTSAGWKFGYGQASGFSGLWISNVTPSTSNYRILCDANQTYLNATADLFLRANNVTKFEIHSVAGQGPLITAGTATADVNALSITQTMNAAAVAFTGAKWTFTEGASGTAAGTLLLNILYGTSGAESTMFSVSKAGALLAAGVEVPTISSTNTFTNKRVTKRVTTETSSATPTINTDNCDMHTITALATNITSFTTNLSGTPTNGQALLLRITDDGNGPYTITHGASFVGSTGLALPTTTTDNKTLYEAFIYNSAAAIWQLTGTIDGFAP